MYSDNQIKHSSELEVKEGYPENDIRLFCFILNRIHWRKKGFFIDRTRASSTFICASIEVLINDSIGLFNFDLSLNGLS